MPESSLRNIPSHGLVIALVVAVACAVAPAVSGAQGIPVETLTLRISDAIGAPGGATAIVFRTYASRPIRRGSVAFAGTAFADAGLALGAGPIASVQGAEFYTPDGIVVPDVLEFDPQTQELLIEFETGLSFLNMSDGVLGAVFVTLDVGVAPGDEFPLNLDPSPLLTFLNDPEDDSHPIEVRGGELEIRAAAAAFEVEVEGGPVHPGSGATVEIGTAEPFAIEAAEIVVEYNPAHFQGPPTATTDPRHGNAVLTVTYPAANRVKVRIDSADDTFNRVPGDVVLLHFSTRRDVALGTLSSIQVIEGGLSWIQGPAAQPRAIQWSDEGIEFESDPGVFRDGFQSGDAWLWSSTESQP